MINSVRAQLFQLMTQWEEQQQEETGEAQTFSFCFASIREETEAAGFSEFVRVTRRIPPTPDQLGGGSVRPINLKTPEALRSDWLCFCTHADVMLCCLSIRVVEVSGGIMTGWNNGSVIINGINRLEITP